MSSAEVEQLTKQRDELKKNQETLTQWVKLKQNLQQKFKSPSEAFKALKKEGKDELAQDDFADYANGIDLNGIFKDQKLNEENFVKIWEQWEFQQRGNQHTLQIIEEKLELIGILDEKEKKNIIRDDTQSKKRIIHQIQCCEDLDELQKKLDTIVSTQQKQPHQELIQNEGDCFNQFLNKKSAIKSGDLQISKIQFASNEQSLEGTVNSQQGQLVESQIVQTGKVTQPKKSYIDGTSAKSKGFMKQQKSPKYYQQNIEVPKPTVSYYKSPPRQQQPQKMEDNLDIRKSQKSKRMKADLQHYISELFQVNDRESRQTYSYSAHQQESGAKGLAGFPIKKYFQPREQQYEQGGRNVQNRVQSIRYKLNDFAQIKVARTSPSRRQQQQQPQSNWTPPNRNLSVPKPKGSNTKSSPYTPGNTKRLNLDRLKQEREQELKYVQDNIFSGQKQQQSEVEPTKVEVVEKKEEQQQHMP